MISLRVIVTSGLGTFYKAFLNGQRISRTTLASITAIDCDYPIFKDLDFHLNKWNLNQSKYELSIDEIDVS